MPRASAGLLPRRTLRTAGGIVFLNIQGFKERILLPTTSGGLSGGHTSTRLAQGPRGGSSRAICCAHTGDSRVPKNLPKIPNYELGTVWGVGWGAPGPGRGSCGIPGDSGVPHPWTAGGWPFPGPHAPTCLSSAPHTPEDCPRRSELRTRPPLRHALRGAEPCGGPGPARGQRPAGAPGLATTHAVWLWAGHVTSLCLGPHPGNGF